MFSFLMGILMGFSLASPPGPINAVIASESLISKRKGILVGTGAMTADFIFMTVSFVIYQVIKPLVAYFYIFASLAMFLLAYSLLHRNSSEKAPKKFGFDYLKGLMLGLTNPFQIGWWVTAGLSFIGIFGWQSVFGLFLAIIVWITLFPTVIALIGYYGGSFVYSLIRWVSAAAIFMFGIYFLYEFLVTIMRRLDWHENMFTFIHLKNSAMGISKNNSFSAVCPPAEETTNPFNAD